MEAPRVVDETEFKNQVNRIYAKDGSRLLVVVKATFALFQVNGAVEVAPRLFRRGVRMIDVHWGAPALTPIRYPSDWVADKPGCDVVFIGSAYAPKDNPTGSFEASFSVGDLKSRLRATGPRVYGDKGDAVSAPRPTLSVPIRWDYAWGGAEVNLSGDVAEEAKNPLGRGVVLDRPSLTHLPAPQLEELGESIKSAHGPYTPAGFGAIGRHFEPRRSRAGTYDNAWQKERSPLPPLDQHALAHSFAAPGLFSPAPLLGNEAVELVNLTPGGGTVGFALPVVRLRIELRPNAKDAASAVVVQPGIDTVIIDASGEMDPPLENGMKRPLVVIEQIYRASIPAPERLGDASVIIDDEL